MTERRAGSIVVSLMLLAMAGCRRESAPPPASSRALPPGVVARVDGRDVTADEVARIAAAQHIDRTHARDIAVRDTLFARAAEARGLTDSTSGHAGVTEELARLMLRRMLADARATPPTEAELRDAAARRWLEVDRPEAFRTVHAVVLADPKDAALRARAVALAETIRAAVAPVADRAATMPLPAEAAGTSLRRIAVRDDPDPLSAAFRRAAGSVPTAGLEVQIEPLPAVTATGRVLAPGENFFDEDFAHAAASLSTRGTLSRVVLSRFGAHVILLLERLPALTLEGRERGAKLRDDIVNERARAAEKSLLARLKGQSSVEPDAAALLARVPVEP